MSSALADKRHIIIFALITAVCLVGDSMLYIVLPVHYQKMGLSSLWEVGAVLSVNRLIRLPLNPIIGKLYSAMSERTGILIAVLLAAITTLSYGFLPNFIWWLAARSVWGLAWSLLRLGSLFCILKLSTPANRGHFTGLYNGLYRLGSLVGMLLGGLLADTVGVQITAIIFGACAALGMVMVLFLFPKQVGQADECAPQTSVMEGLAAVSRHRSILLAVVTGGIMAFIFQGVTASTLSRLISEHTGGGMAVLGAVMGASTIGGILQALRWGWEPWLAPLAGRLSDRPGGRARMLLAVFGASAVIFALIAAPLPLPLWFTALLGMQLAATALTTISDAAASDAASLAGGRAVLMGYALIVDIGAALGPLVAYGINEICGINAVYALCAVICAALVFVWRPSAAVASSSR